MKFIEKLVDIQSSLVAQKDKKNEFGGFAYRTAEGILASVKPLLAKHGLFMSINDEIIQIGNENHIINETVTHTPNKEGHVTIKTTRNEVKDGRFYLKATVTVTDGNETISSSALARETLSKKGMDDAQATGAASSYARKYALNAFFGIDDSKQDPDSGHANQRSNLIAQVDAIFAKCTTKEAAQAELNAIKAALSKDKDALAHAIQQLKTNYS